MDSIQYILFLLGKKRGELIKMWGTNKKKTERDGEKKKCKFKKILMEII